MAHRSQRRWPLLPCGASRAGRELQLRGLQGPGQGSHARCASARALGHGGTAAARSGPASLAPQVWLGFPHHRDASSGSARGLPVSGTAPLRALRAADPELVANREIPAGNCLDSSRHSKTRATWSPGLPKQPFSHGELDCSGSCPLLVPTWSFPLERPPGQGFWKKRVGLQWKG
jgi:hypothetical protein